MSNTTTAENAAKKDVTKLQRAIVDGLEDVKAQDIVVFNTEHLSPLFERVIVASGASSRQTKALASSVREAVKKAGFPVPRHEGEENGEWIIVDCGQCVVHVMQPTIRQYYRLEEIWGDKPVRVKLGGGKPSKRSASEDDSEQDGAVKKAAPKKPKAEKTEKAGKAEKVEKTDKPVKKKSADKKPADKKTVVKKVAKSADIQTVVIKPTTARGAAKKPSAVRAAKKA